jgi:hypothetical protein
MPFFRDAYARIADAVGRRSGRTRHWGKSLLADRLEFHGVDPTALPDDCLQELTDQAIDLAAQMAKLLRQRCRGRDLSHVINNQACVVAAYLNGEVTLQSERPGPVFDLLRRYRVLPDGPARPPAGSDGAKSAA